MYVENWKRDRWINTISRTTNVVTLPSGLMYKVLHPRYFGRSAVPKSNCVCHYKGELYSGKIFDSSYETGKPITCSPDDAIKGLSEALQLMKEGEKWELYIPGHLAYGNEGYGEIIPPDCPLQFTIELIKVEGEYKNLSSK